MIAEWKLRCTKDHCRHLEVPTCSRSEPTSPGVPTLGCLASLTGVSLPLSRIQLPGALTLRSSRAHDRRGSELAEGPGMQATARPNSGHHGAAVAALADWFTLNPFLASKQRVSRRARGGGLIAVPWVQWSGQRPNLAGRYPYARNTVELAPFGPRTPRWLPSVVASLLWDGTPVSNHHTRVLTDMHAIS